MRGCRGTDSHAFFREEAGMLDGLVSTALLCARSWVLELRGPWASPWGAHRTLGDRCSLYTRVGAGWGCLIWGEGGSVIWAFLASFIPAAPHP